MLEMTEIYKPVIYDIKFTEKSKFGGADDHLKKIPDLEILNVNSDEMKIRVKQSNHGFYSNQLLIGLVEKAFNGKLLN